MSADEPVTELAEAVEKCGALPMPVPVGPEPQPPTVERLAEIEARAEAATAGPWWTDTLAEHDGSESVGIDAEGDIWIVPCQDLDPADAEFMAHAREDVPALVAEVRRQAARIAELEARLGRVKETGARLGSALAARTEELMAAEKSLREPDGEFYGLMHHDWRLGRDLPEMAPALLAADQTHTGCGMPLTRRLECGHCPHEVCEDCDRCPCQCATGGGS